MALNFRSIRSSSKGNCLMLWTDCAAILIDCGLKAQYLCEQVVNDLAPRRLDAAVVSHAHTDHIGYPALRVLGRKGVPVYCPAHAAGHIRGRHLPGCDPAPPVHAFADGGLSVGDLHLLPIPVAHDPGCPNVAFVVTQERGAAARKIILCTDFCRPDGLVDHFANCDFLFIEANHDLELLRRFPNHASRWHMSNPATGRLLVDVMRHSDFAPQAVMLGHLSEQRNTEELAVLAVRQAFESAGEPIRFRLLAAPRHTPSDVIAVQ